MRNLKYTVFFQPAEEGGYTVSIPMLPGCISEGDTFEEALANIKEAAELYLEDIEREKFKILPVEDNAFVAPLRLKI